MSSRLTLDRRTLLGGGLALASLAAVGCSPTQAASNDTGSGSTVTVGFRLWDEQVAKAYETSFAEFTKRNPGITVKINLVPWANYWQQLPIDVGADQVDDIFWTNSSNFIQYAEAGKISDITALLGVDPAWQSSIVEQYSHNGSLWGVPQIADANGVFYNESLVSAAGVDPANLTWAPQGSGSDTLLAALQKLTVDGGGRTAAEAGFDPKKIKTYGYNAAFDLQAIYFPFLASNGGKWQADGSNRFVFGDDPKTVEAFEYIVSLINDHHVAPSAADTNDNGDFSRDQFLQGNLAIFQSGTYNLSNVADGADFSWKLAPLPAGPAGRYSVASGVVAVASAATKNADATKQVLQWIGGEGNRYIGESGSALPAVRTAQTSWVDHWKGKDVDVTPFVEAVSGSTIAAPRGTGGAGSAEAYQPILKEVFLGRIPVKEGLAQAQQAGNKAIGT